MNYTAFDIEASLYRHFQTAVQSTATAKNDAFVCYADQLAIGLTSTKAKRILVVLDAGNINPFEPDWASTDHFFRWELRYMPTNDRRHNEIIDALESVFRPNMTVTCWDTSAGIDNWAAWTPHPGGLYVKDHRHSAGYSGTDERYILPFVVYLRYRKRASV